MAPTGAPQHCNTLPRLTPLLLLLLPPPVFLHPLYDSRRPASRPFFSGAIPDSIQRKSSQSNELRCLPI